MTTHQAMTLHAFAKQQLDTFSGEYGAPADQASAVERWMRLLAGTDRVPEDILEAMPEVSRHNSPQVSPQEYECGCVAITRITDRESRYDEEPFEMRLAIPCGGTACALGHLRTNIEHTRGTP